ncbi:MAG TPA: hypothetical protein VNA89_05865 [Gemmatimonadaceae bacterium]|nr:hypothetical protein [Gemmatimonadaceae bacterium]
MSLARSEMPRAARHDHEMEAASGMSKRDGKQKGAAPHAEGQHGEKTHQRFLEQLQERHEPEAPEQGQTAEGGGFTPNASTGRHRLEEERQQHDEAEKNSEKGRLLREGHWGPPDANGDPSRIR